MLEEPFNQVQVQVSIENLTKFHSEEWWGLYQSSPSVAACFSHLKLTSLLDVESLLLAHEARLNFPKNPCFFRGIWLESRALKGKKGQKNKTRFLVGLIWFDERFISCPELPSPEVELPPNLKFVMREAFESQSEVLHAALDLIFEAMKEDSYPLVMALIAKHDQWRREMLLEAQFVLFLALEQFEIYFKPIGIAKQDFDHLFEMRNDFVLGAFPENHPHTWVNRMNPGFWN